MFKKIIITVSLAFLLLAPVLVLGADKYGLESAAGTAGLKETKMGKYDSPMNLIGDVIGIGLGFLGIVFFGLFFYAGVQWMLSRGNAEAVNKAKDIMEAAVVGLILVLSAYAISKFVFENFIGA